MDIALLSVDNPYTKIVGGKSVYQRNLYRKLKERQVRVHEIYYPYNGTWCGRLWRFIRYPLSIVSKARWGCSTLDDEIQYFASISLRDDVDIVHAQDVVSAYGLLMNRYYRNVPIVITLHGYVVDEMKLRYGLTDMYLKWVRMIEETAFDGAVAIVVPSRERYDYISREYPRLLPKAKIIYNGVDTDRFKPVSEAERAKLRQEYGLRVDIPVVVYIGRLDPIKGIRCLVEAIEKIEEGVYQFVFVGSGSDVSLIKRLAEVRSDVRYLGVLDNDDIWQIYALSDVFILPSIALEGIKEGLPLSLIEAMASGNIVIITPVGGMEEVVEDGVSGIFIKEKDANDIVEKLRYVRDNLVELRSSMSISARERVVKYYSLDAHVDKVVNLYKEILAIKER